MNDKWYEGTTGIPPLDDAIHGAQKYGYTHHINRLMVLANIMNLCRIDPKKYLNGLWNVCGFFLIGSWYPMYLEWVHFPMVELFQLNLTFVDQAIC